MNEKNHEPRCELTLEKGERAALCRCWQSKKFPYCDGSHRELSDSVGPVIIHSES
jgi:CDGSH-type Zn-finger protein